MTDDTKRRIWQAVQRDPNLTELVRELGERGDLAGIAIDGLAWGADVRGRSREQCKREWREGNR